MKCNVGMELECVYYINYRITDSVFDAYEIGTDGGGVLVEIRSRPTNDKNSMYQEVKHLLNSIMSYKEGVLVQHPDYASGLHVHIDDSVRYIKDEFLVRFAGLFEVLQSKKRSLSAYSAEVNIFRLNSDRIEFRFLPSSIFLMKKTFSEVVRTLRIYSSLPKKVRHMIPNIINDAEILISRIVNSMPILKYKVVSVYDTDIEFEYSSDIFVVKPHATACIPIRVFGLSEVRGENTIYVPEFIDIDGVEGYNVISCTDMSFGISRDIRIDRDRMMDAISKIEDAVRRSTVSISNMEKYDEKLYPYFKYMNNYIIEKLNKNVKY